MLSVLYSSHVSKYYLKWVIEPIAEAKKVLHAKKKKIRKGTTENDSSRNGKDRAKDPTAPKRQPRPSSEGQQVKKGLGTLALPLFYVFFRLKFSAFS